MAESFIEFSGILNILAGILLLIYWYSFALFLPYGRLSTTLSLLVENRNWTWINAVGVLGALSGLLGQAGIYLAQLDTAGWLGTSGFFIAVAGTTLLIGTMLWDTILYPILDKHDAKLLDFQGPIYRSKTFLPYFIIAGMVYAVGYVLVGAGIAQVGILPKVGGWLLAIGAPTFSLGSLFGKAQVYPRSIGVTLLSVGLIWLGISMV